MVIKPEILVAKKNVLVTLATICLAILIPDNMYQWSGTFFSQERCMVLLPVLEK